MPLGLVAIVGAPNVGKSTLFNRMVGERASIVEDTPGVTRDRLYGTGEWLTRRFRIVDTGGIEIKNAPFQEEIRAFVYRLGAQISSRMRLRMHTRSTDNVQNLAMQIVRACQHLSQSKTGALIILAGNHDLRAYIDTGEKIDAKISARLVEYIFFKNSPLHDGAVIIRGGRIVAARCTLPITERTDIPARYGMRHKAAIGITEKTDARVIVVSEQTGEVSFAADGIITRMNGKSMLKLKLGDDGQKTGSETGV